MTKITSKSKKNHNDSLFEDAAPQQTSDMISQNMGFQNLFESSLEASNQNWQNKLQIGDKIRSEILSMGKDELFVSTGTPYDGTVLKSHLKMATGEFPYKVGDVLDLYVIQVKDGDIRLSPHPTDKNIAEDLEDAFDMMLPVEGRVLEPCTGGVRVQVMGKTAFCPISQLDLARVEDLQKYLGKKYEFQITQFSERGRNIVLSRRKLLEEQRELSIASFIESHKEGQIVQGRVTRLEKYGAFVELSPEGLEGLVHISEVSWSRLDHPDEVLQENQMVNVKILKMETLQDGKMKISLSIKQVDAEPWSQLPDTIRVGQTVEGKVVRCLKFGAFVQLLPGVDGLIPLSEMSYTKRVVRSDELFKEGDSVVVMIKEIQPQEKRISLSLKDAGNDPWALVQQKFPVGSIQKGIVQRKEPYGIFVQLEPGVVGLLPKSKISEVPEFSWDKCKIHDSVVVTVNEISYEARRMSLGLPSDPEAGSWKDYASQQSSSSAAGPSAGSFGTLGDQFKNMFKK